MQNEIYLIHTSKTGKLVLDTELDKQMTYKGELCDSVMYFNLPLQGADLTRLYKALQVHAEDQESAGSAKPENLFPEKPDPEEADISPYFADHIPLAKAFFKGKGRKRAVEKQNPPKLSTIFKFSGDIWGNPILRHSIRRHTGSRPYGVRSRVHDRSIPGDHAVDIGSNLVVILDRYA